MATSFMKGLHDQIFLPHLTTRNGVVIINNETTTRSVLAHWYPGFVCTADCGAVLRMERYNSILHIQQRGLSAENGLGRARKHRIRECVVGWCSRLSSRFKPWFSSANTYLLRVASLVYRRTPGSVPLQNNTHQFIHRLSWHMLLIEVSISHNTSVLIV